MLFVTLARAAEQQVGDFKAQDLDRNAYPKGVLGKVNEKFKEREL